MPFVGPKQFNSIHDDDITCGPNRSGRSRLERCGDEPVAMVPAEPAILMVRESRAPEIEASLLVANLQESDAAAFFQTKKQTFLSKDDGHEGNWEVRPMVCREPAQERDRPNGAAWEPETPQTGQGLSPSQRKRVKASIRRHMATLKKLS